MRLNWKNLRWLTIAAGLLLGTGCSGINVGKSFSPLDFLLPGILEADPPPAHPVRELPADPPAMELAQF